ncbi:hypothetical protein AB0B45_35585 [Nonomuraea sp. NPDC049152]|uniref:hypothetical protein n=1 Tax=Nonomuraea sp. NPDC049152 TaxID=3154350 RepID=UPI00340C6DD5
MNELTEARAAQAPSDTYESRRAAEAASVLDPAGQLGLTGPAGDLMVLAGECVRAVFEALAVSAPG